MRAGSWALDVLGVAFALLAVFASNAAASRAAHAVGHAAHQRPKSSLLPPALCGQILAQTYGALRGWAPRDAQLQDMCVGLLAGPMQVVRGREAAHSPCQAFVAQRPVASAASESWPKLLQQWCQSAGDVDEQRSVEDQAALAQQRQVTAVVDDVRLPLRRPASKPQGPTPPRRVASKAKVLHQHRTSHGVASLVGQHQHHVDAAAMLKAREALLGDGEAASSPPAQPTPAHPEPAVGRAGGLSLLAAGDANEGTDDTDEVDYQAAAPEGNAQGRTSASLPKSTSARSPQTRGGAASAPGTSPLAGNFLELARRGAGWLRDASWNALNFACDYGLEEQHIAKVQLE